METAASFEARKAPSSYPTILGEAMETSASFEARSAPLPYPTKGLRARGANPWSVSEWRVNFFDNAGRKVVQGNK